MRRFSLLLPFLYALAMVASAAAQTASPSPTPQKTPERIYYWEILQKLELNKKIIRPIAVVNAEIIEAIKTRGIRFVLEDRDRKELKKAGASDELIRVIDTALSDSEKQKVRAEQKEIDEINRVYQIVLDNYKSAEVEKFERAVKAAKEFLARFGTDERAKDIVKWLTANLPGWERYLIGRKSRY